ncbi:tRNA-specific 2-thiouridylase [Cantharellus anzutake]|uniref:tRNA-specific 2-thiouridylase n=1 Tax=Cantharellus anzutake TaxID=1750568 RepID=UPI0019040A50|nr:tRNA-specific 2-thiouridylase [Cantharellus anzutake]KAF8344154.1 tRNA-specific 2-thiouridylase [Cantharellus anzutake]
MSGGVDSSLSAQLLACKDYDLRAVFMRNWDTRDERASDVGCEWERDWEDVQRVCRYLGIPCQMIDLSRQYWTRVFEPALDEWVRGATPNPDVSCNREIKFGALFDRVITSPKQWLATGHYAQIAWGRDGQDYRPKLMRAKDPVKDQTYYLASVTEAKLRQALFPVGHMTKAEVREDASRCNLPTATRKESMGICFVGERGHFDEFLSQYIQPTRGNIVDLGGTILGQHNGLHRYTIGQRAGLGGRKSRTFVAQKRTDTNEIVVVDRGDHPALMCSSLTVRDWHWVSSVPSQRIDSEEGYPVICQIRHRMRGIPAQIRRRQEPPFPGKHLCEITFEEPAHAATPGQIAVVWDGDWCLGCGRIDKIRTLHGPSETF